MKDIFGNTIEVGDEVAFNQPSYKNLIKGEVVKINPKMLRLRYRDDQSRAKRGWRETNEWSDDVVVNMEKRNAKRN